MRAAYRIVLGVFFIAILPGCVGLIPNMEMNPKFWSGKQHTIGVAIESLPMAKTHKTGSQGLIDVLINDANASDLDEHLAKQDLSSISELRDRMVAYLNEKGFKTVKIEESIDTSKLKSATEDANQQSQQSQVRNDSEDDEDSDHQSSNSPRDYRELKSKYQIGKLLLISVHTVGTIRSYYGFIPTSQPKGVSYVNGRVINLESNEMEWNYLAKQTTPNPEKQWDVPPSFPGLTKAMYTAYEQSQHMLFNEFTQ